MAKVFWVSALVMVEDPAKPNEMARGRGDTVDYFLPGADAEATRSALVAALRAAGFRRVDKDVPPQYRFSTDESGS